MKPEYKIKKTILLGLLGYIEEDLGRKFEYSLENEEGIEIFWNELEELDYLQDPRNEFREGQEETNLPSEFNRNYEAKSVSAQMFDGSWVGWTYWYGGGKHGEPEAIDWMEYSYDLDCKEEEKIVTVRTFSLKLD